jgi:PAS domain S-box-containing protein
MSETNAYLAAIVEGSDDAIVGKTLDGIVTSWNRGAERIFGLTAAEMIGESIYRIVPDDRRGDVRNILDTIRRGDRIEHFETERVRSDGTRLRVSLTVSPIRDESGRVVGASKIARDVSDRYRAENALRETLAVLTALNRTSIMLAAELDTEKLVRAVTEATTQITRAKYGAFFYNVRDDAGESYMLYTLAGVDPAAFAGFPMPRNTAVFGPTFRGEGIVRLDDVTQDPRYGHNAPYHGTPPGHLPVKSYLAAPVSLRGEVLGGLFFGHPDPGVFTDMDERFLVGVAAQAAVAMDNARLYQAAQKARGDAEAANRIKDEFLSMVSHELRTPLSSIMGWVAVLRQGKLSASETERAFETIKRNGQMQTELIDDLLDVSRVVSGRFKIEPETTDLVQVLHAALEGIKPDVTAKGIQLDFEAMTQLTIHADPTRLQQVFANVIGNAIKFTPSGGWVRIQAEADSDSARVIVRDSGRGIERDFLPLVFEPFRQAEEIRTRNTGGLGLGLAIAKGIVERHGGSIEARSAGRDQGATFTVVLPLSGASQVEV